MHKIRNCAKCPLGRTKSAAPGSRPEEWRGSGVQSLATMSGATTYHTRECPVLPGFCKCRNILLHLRAPIAPDQNEKAAFSGAAVSCSLQIRLDKPQGVYTSSCVFYQPLPRSVCWSSGRSANGGGRETRHSRACVRAFQVSGRFSNKSRQFSYLPGAPLQSRRLSGACKR